MQNLTQTLRKNNKGLTIYRKSLLLNVARPGFEPGTSGSMNPAVTWINNPNRPRARKIVIR